MVATVPVATVPVATAAVATAPVVDELVVTGWSAVSPFGLGADAFSAGLRAGRDAVGTLDLQRWPGPFERAGLIPGFDIAQVLGRKGTRSMDRATGIAVATVGMLLDQQWPGGTEHPESIGLVLGTGSGSVQSIMDFTRDTLTGEKPFHVDPARFPNTVMNRAAGQSAIWHRLKGVNTTIAGGALTGLLALNYAARLHRRGRCEVILCGAVEEFSVQRSWLEWHGRSGDEGAGPLGEGCAVFLLESAAGARRHGREPLATVLGSSFAAFGEPDAARPAVARSLAAALERAGLGPADVRLVAASGATGRLGKEESAGIGDVLGGHLATVRRVDCRKLLGDTSAASAAFQLAAVLSGASRGTVAAVTSVDRDGTAGCTLLCLGPGTGRTSQAPDRHGYERTGTHA